MSASEGHLPAVTLRRLIRVRQLYNEAKLQSDQGTDFGTFQATLLLDLSVEQFLRAAAVHLNCPPDNRDPNFKELWVAVEKALTSQEGRSLPLKNEILHSLRPARNMTQHQGDAPSRWTVERYQEYVGDFLRQSVEEVFGQDWADLSPVHLVSDDEVRAYLLDAEGYIRSDDTMQAAQRLAVAHYLIRQKLAEPFGDTDWQDRVRDLVPRVSRHLCSEGEGGNEIEDFKSLWWALSEELRNLRMRIRLVQAGIPLDAYERVLDGLPFIVMPIYESELDVEEAEEGRKVLSVRGIPLGKDVERGDWVTRRPTYPREDDGVPEDERWGYASFRIVRMDRLPPPPTEEFCRMALTTLADIATRIPERRVPEVETVSLADRIREFASLKYVQPARNEGKRTVTIRAGDIHSMMRLSSRLPAVCGALGAKKFQETYGVKLIKREGPIRGANTLFTFEV